MNKYGLCLVDNHFYTTYIKYAMCRVDVHGGLAEQQRSAREEQAHGHQQGNEKGVGGGHGGGREGGGGRYLHIQCPAPDGLE